MRSKSIFASAAAVTILALSPLLATASTEVTLIKAAAVESEISGEVAVVNPETRMLTIRTADGTFEVLHAPPEVERLGEVRIGDKLTVMTSTLAVLELEQGRDAGAMGVEGQTEVQRTQGDEPGGSITDTVTLYGQVVGVDAAAGTVTVKGAESTDTYEVEDKSLLKELNVKKGDGVIVTISHVIAGQISR